MNAVDGDGAALEGLLPWSDRLSFLTERAREVTRRVGGDTKIPLLDPDGKTPFLDAFESDPDGPYANCLANAVVESWLVSERVIQPHEIIVGVARPPRPLFEHFHWGIVTDLNVLDAPAYAAGAGEYRRRYERLKARLHPMTFDVVDEAGASRLGSREAFEATKYSLWWVAGYQGHTVPDFGKLLKLGISGILEEIRMHRRRHAEPGKVELLSACERIYQGLSRWIESYADLADAMQRDATETGIRSDLEGIARTCRAVALDPPRTLREAVQLLWFYALWDDVDSLGRIDQYLYPFYARDLDAGVLDGDGAVEILGALWINLMRWSAHTLAVGGQTGKGDDATNELTYTLLKISRRLHDTHPRVCVRVHDRTDESLIRLGVRMWSEGMCDPTFVNDESVVEGLHRYGVALGDARDYTVLGCNEIEVPGRSNTGCEDGTFSLAKCMELALNNGLCRISGIRIGPATGDPRCFKTFDEVRQAYRAQVEFFVPHFVALCNVGVGIRSANLAKLVRMPLTADCLARGLDPDGGGAVYGNGEVETLGIGAAADQLTAVRKVVFEDGLISMSGLVDLLDSDFAGKEDLRLVLLNGAPKYGNDDAVADETAREIAEHFWLEMGKHRSVRGGRFYGASSLLGRGVEYGLKTGAGADGKKAGEPLGNTSGPRTGVDTGGLTAMLRSVARLPFEMAPGGAPCNVKIPASLMSTPKQRDKIIALIRSFFREGGQLLQATTVDSETLRKARAHPEQYRDLIVRVGGFSARFGSLSAADQNEIIARGEGL